MLLLNINRKPYGESNGTFTFNLEWSWKIKLKVTQISGQSQGHTDFKALYLVKEQSYAISYY